MSIGEFPTPVVDEGRRLAAVEAAAAAAAESSGGLQRLVTLVANLLGFPAARLTLVEAETTLTAVADGAPCERVSREHSFCTQAIRDPEHVLVVPDALLDARFASSPYVGDELRSYLGAPLVGSDGCAIGALCVTDCVPREATDAQIETLRMLAGAVAAELEHSRQLIAIAEVTAALARCNDLAEVQQLICDAPLSAGADGAVLLVSDGARLDVVASSESSPDSRVLVPVGPGTLTGRVCLSGKAEFHGGRSEEVPAMTRGLMQRAGALAIAAYPVGEAGPDGAPGVLLVFWRRRVPQLPGHVDRFLTVLADQAAVALERATLVATLDGLSRIDTVTGLPNRRMLDESIDREVARAARTREPLAVAMLDLDHFKTYNDRHGHQPGDLLLRQAAVNWSAAVRRTDLVARYGGDEFALVLPSCEPTAAVRLAERVRAAVPPGQTCSIGLVFWDGVETPVALLERADAALYRAKRDGRDRLVVGHHPPADAA
jgi:diguanylate cyclase (GGDEF)-like protein